MVPAPRISPALFMALASAAACGRLAYDAHDADAGVEDAGVDGGAVLDAAVDAAEPRDAPGPSDADAPTTACSTWGPWVAPVEVFSFAAGNDAWLSSVGQDELTVMLHPWSPTTQNDIWTATRVSPTATFSAPAPLSELNTPDADGFGLLLDAGMTVYFSSTRPGGPGGADIWTTTRPAAALPFGTATPVDGLNTAANESALVLSVDRLRLYFISDRAGDLDVYFAERVPAGGPVTRVARLDALSMVGARERSIWVSTDELEAFFCSERPGGVGGFDIWTATRSSIDVPFDAPTNVATLNTGRDDVYPVLSPDGRRLYFNQDASLGGAPGARAAVSVTSRDCLD